MPMTEDGYVQGDGWVAGVDFDPRDPEEMEIMAVIFEGERLSALDRLQSENDRLRGVIASKKTEEEQDAADGAADYAAYRSGWYDRD